MQKGSWHSPSGMHVPVGKARDPAEREANAVAARIVNGDAATRLRIASSPAPSLFGSPGRRLDPSERSRLGRTFEGLDRVRIHEGQEASAAALGLGARAFAFGSELAFASGQYRRGTRAGDRLLVHELAHLAQGGSVIRRQPIDEAETEEEEEEENEESPLIHSSRSLLSLDYSGPQVCGGRPCFTDQMIYQGLETSAADKEAVDTAMSQVPAPSATVGQFAVSIGELSDRPTAADVGPAAVAGTANVPTAKPPAADPRIVIGARDLTGVEGAIDLQEATGQQIVRLKRGMLAGVDEMSLLAHANTQTVTIDAQRLTPDQLAKRLYKAGWRGSVIRLVACDTGTMVGPPTYAQQLADELAKLGVETTVIAPKGTAASGGKAGILPRVVPPGARNIVGNLQRLGKGWGFFSAEVPLGERPLPWRHPGTVTGAGWAGGKMAAMMALSYLHSKAVAKRVEQEREETGFADWGPTGDTLYDVGAWFLDPTDEAGRSIPFSQRFDMAAWRANFARRAAEQPVGKKWKVSWTTSGDPDPLGNPTYRKFYGIYIKRPDGWWSTWGCKDCEGDDFPPDINKIIDPTISDEEIREYLELPGPYADSTIA